jgi:hypothetical protein
MSAVRVMYLAFAAVFPDSLFAGLIFGGWGRGISNMAFRGNSIIGSDSIS